MSARTAFESLAREAMERQDYWLAESLLREYLTAGPRYVPFLEMLGRVYEEKGDVMAAVAEYGKAVEVLLEDPDSEKPNHPSELFARIRLIAPGSPVSFRLAAMFDTVTGQVLQATPQPQIPVPESESPQAAAAEAPPEGVVPMPWEQMEPQQADGPVPPVPFTSTVAPPTDIIEPVMPPAVPMEDEPAVEPSKLEIDHSPAPESSQLQTTLASADPVVPSLSPVGFSEEPTKAAAESEPPATDPLPALTSETELAPPTVSLEPSPMSVALVQVGADPISHAPSSPAPMPWDQVEDVAVVIPPASASQGSTVSDEGPPVSSEPEVALTPEGEAVRPSIEVLAETGSHPIAPAPFSPAPMPWDQGAEEAVAIPPFASQVPAAHESLEVSTPETELPPVHSGDPAPHAIEVLSQSGSHPIVAPPTTPVSMPWDQVEEHTISIPPAVALATSSVAEGAPETCEESPSLPVIEAVNSAVEVPTQQVEAPAAPPAASSASEMTSSGLSWDEILAAVAAMQSSPAPAQSLPSVEPNLVSDRPVTEEPAPAVTATADAVEAETISLAPPSELPVDPGSASLTLSAPMPWEQIEVEDVTIPRQEPEPEFGSASFAVEAAKGSDGMTQDATLLLPAVPEPPEAVGEVESPTIITEPPVGTVEESARWFRTLSPDEQQEPHNNLLHTPVESSEATRAEELSTSFDAVPCVEVAKEEAPAISLRLVENDALPLQAAAEPVPVNVEPITEFTLAGTTVETGMAEASEPVPQAGHALEEIAAPEVMTPPESAPMDESVASPVSLSPVEDPAISLAEAVALEAQAEVSADLPAVEIEAAPVLSLEPELKPDKYEVGDSAPPVAEVASIELTDVQPVPVEESLPVVPAEMSIVAPTEDPGEVLVAVPQAFEPIQAEQPVDIPAEPATVVEAEVPAPAASVPSDAPTSDGLHILWEDASSAPTPKPSTGNMLTRWLKKSAEPVAPEVNPVSPSTPVPDEPVVAVASPPIEEAVPAAVVSEQPSERIEQAPAVVAEEPPHRPAHIQPAGPGVWSRVGEAAASLVGAGVSTTRSLMVLVLALIGLVLFAVGGTIAAVALMWLILEEQPNAAYRTMTSVPQQTLQDSTKNGYLLLLGLGAAANQDPVQVGVDRRVEGADRAFTHTCLTGEGYSPDAGLSASADAAGKWMKAADPALQMQMDATGLKTWLSQAEVSLNRYRQWLNKPFEDVGYGQSISPNCGLILQTHRLYLADGFAQDVDTGIGRLETDLTAWRTVLGQAKSLPVKMLASAAMNDDIAVMGGLLQRSDLDERYVSRMAKLARPLEPSEQSLRWPMQSQFVLATKTLDEAVSQNRADTRPFYGAIAAALPLPKQRRFNAYADYYEAAGKAAADGRYADLPKLSQFVRVAPYSVSAMVVNPIESVVGVDPLPTWETYAGRVLETDARLRLASLQAWLRRTLPEQDLLTRLAKAGQGLYDPFTGLPMLVNMKKSVLYSVGPDLKDNEAHERLDLVAQIPSVAWVGGKKSADGGKTK